MDMLFRKYLLEKLTLIWHWLSVDVKARKDDRDVGTMRIQVVFNRIYMEFKKMVMKTLYAKQKKRHRYTEQTFRLCGRRRGWDVQREQH